MNNQPTPNADSTNPLSTLSLTELWDLFPLALVEPRGDWANQYRTMKTLLEQLLPDVSNVRISHIHLRYREDNDELYFRDYLKDHADIAREYEALKLELCAQCFPDRDACTDGKTAFIQKWTHAAKSLYGNRY